MTDLLDSKPKPCSRCGRPNAEYRVDLKPVCALCISLLEKLRRFNSDLFAKGRRQ